MAAHVPQNFRRVITAAAGGNVIEWYDFYIFGSLAAILSVKFFEKSHPVAALLSTIALFTAGFLVRPLGAFVFGWLGDVVGRKYTFIMTLVGMALGTGAIGLNPDLRPNRPGRRGTSVACSLALVNRHSTLSSSRADWAARSPRQNVSRLLEGRSTA